ncbi:MAG: hypothetical protein YHS30scaffold667_36 [Phage 65_10]|nr:MAG: hypothetical protein YHS30scaffold667_36 [Phage 65_10]
MPYPLLERSTDVEVPSPRRGRPSYRWVTGWVVRYSESRVSTPMRYREAQILLRQVRES